MDGIRIQCAKLLSHGLAVAVGVGCGWLLPGLRASKNSGLTGDPPPVPDPEISAAAWVDRTLLAMREKETAAKAAVVDLEKLSVPELLRYQRREADRKRGELDARVAAIIQTAPRYQRVTDPAGAIASAFRRETSADEALAVFQSWLDRDPDAALAHLRRNWRLLADLEPVPVLLERKFGREWQLARLADEATPIRMKRMLAAGIGQALGWHAGLAEALAASRKLADSDLADLLMENFVGAWPLAEPATVAGLLAGKLPADDRRRLLDSWVPSVSKNPFSDGFIAWDASRVSNFEWFRRVRDALPAELVPEDLRGITASSADEPKEKAPFDLADEIANRIASGKPRESAVYVPLRRKLDELLAEHPVLLDDYAAGRLSRRELLDHLCDQIPGAAAYPVELEQLAWLIAAQQVEPELLVKWAAVLPKGDVSDEIILEGISDNVMIDPRARHSLERYRLLLGKDGIASLSSDSYRMRDNLWSSWQFWIRIAPMAAVEWRKALPPGDPVGKELDRQDAENQARDPSP